MNIEIIVVIYGTMVDTNLIELAELELTNAIVHPDRYNVALRRKFVDDLYTYTDYSVMLSDYIAHQTQYAREYPNDSKYLTQMYLFITRLQQHIASSTV
jgi:hypothetical protein